jgi:starvation-inducible outer membrane lipoprotein
MRFLLLSSCLLMLAGCSSVYKNLKPAEGNLRDIKKFAPDFSNVLYKTEVDVIGGHHLSGLLLIKNPARQKHTHGVQ